MTFSGAKIRRLRESLDMTQVELAEKASVTQSFISDLEGNKKFPNMKTMIRIAQALGVTVNDLFEYE
jgi:transcriptional regulator with XRE-family HTH domain